MDAPNTAKCPSRGRPPTDTHRHVIQDLMNAAEAALKSKTVKETTIREIAVAAGTNEAMINYYFGGKEGLMIALLHEKQKDHPNKHAQQIADLCIERSSIGPLIERLTAFYDSRPSLVRMTLSEVMSGSSNIKTYYHKEFSEDTPNFIYFVINSMIEAGVYGDHLDIEFIATSIMSMIVAPNFLQAFAQAVQKAGQARSREWIEHITKTIDMSARPPAH